MTKTTHPQSRCPIDYEVMWVVSLSVPRALFIYDAPMTLAPSRNKNLCPCWAHLLAPVVKLCCASGASYGRTRCWTNSRTHSVESVRRSCADWRDVTPEQDALLQQHTIQTEHRRKKSWTRRGKLLCVALLTGHVLSGFVLETIHVFESRRLHFWHSSGTWMVFAPIGTSFRLLSRAC